MPDPADPPVRTLDDAQEAVIASWLDDGLAVQALPWLDLLRQGNKARTQVLAARVLRHLGDDRRSEALSLWLGRRWRTDPDAQVTLLRTVLGRNGAYAFWRADQRWAQPDAATPLQRAARSSIRGCWLGVLRDATAALAAHREALQLWATEPWLWVEQAQTLERLDRRAEAMESIEEALRLAPRLRAGLQYKATLLWQANEHDAAESLLTEAWQVNRNGHLAWQLQGMVKDRDRHQEALAWIDRAEAALPLADVNWRSQIAARRADALLRLGQDAAARAQALQVAGTGFYSRLAERLAEASTERKRVHLSLEQVQQHWSTCAPATLTALARFWGREADHLEIAQAICYDGTPVMSQRRWAEQQGFIVREFKPDWTSCRALLDAGLPFALATQWVGGGHLQAVVGYDHLRRTVLVRDPSAWLHVEHDADALFDEEWRTGDRAMLLVPPEAATRLDGLPLPDAEDWDHGYAFNVALERHDRAAACAALERLQALRPKGERTLRVRRALAIYDGDEAQILAATEALLERLPKDTMLLLSRAASLLAVKGQAEADAVLEALAHARNPDPLVLARWSSRLALDGRRLPEALFHVRRALRRDGGNGRAWSELSDRLWQREGASAALLPARWASALMPTEEWAAQNHAKACRIAGCAEAGVDWLRQREAEWGDRSGAPSITLADELDTLQRTVEGDAVLDAAMLRRPSDTALRLALADRLVRRRQPQAALDTLSGRHEASEPDLLHLRALALELGDSFDEARAMVEQALHLAPLNLGLHRLLLRLLRRRHGDSEALALWRPLADARPAHVGLQQLLYDQLPVHDPQAQEAQLDRMLTHHPTDDWLQRERAIVAARQGRFELAEQLARAALDMAPQRAVSHNVLGHCVWRHRGYAAAATHWRQALLLDVEFESAMESLMDGPDAQARRAATDFVAEELGRQPLVGDGLLMFQRLAPGGWTDAQVLDLLTTLASSWPDLWQTGIALARQLARVGRHDEAIAALDASAARFPLLPRVHLERAEALRVASRLDEALQAGARALDLAPSWNPAVRHQVDLLDDYGGRQEEGLAVVDRALSDRHGFDDADLIALRAWLLAGLQRDTAALAEARRSLRMDPRPNWVWGLVRRICERQENLSALDELVEDVVHHRPGDAVAWIVRGRQCRDAQLALQHLDRALALDPWRLDAWRERFERLHRLGRGDEIVQILEGQTWRGGEDWPMDLLAWRPRVRWGRGERSEAIAELDAICQRTKVDADLWRELADWCDEADDTAGYLAAAERALERDPAQARSHLYLGHALYRCGRPQEALAPLQRAVTQNPNYPFAAFALADAAAECRQPHVALPALEALWPAHRKVRTATRAIELATQARDEAAAFRWLDRLMELESFEIPNCQTALGHMVDVGWGRVLERRQRAHLRAGGGPVGVAFHWLKDQNHGPMLLTLWVARRWLQRHPNPHLLKALARWLKEGGARWSLRWLVRDQAAALRADDEAWGEISYDLLELRDYRAVRTWTADWAQRERAPLWALSNRCGALAFLRDWGQIDAVVKGNLQRSPDDADLRFWELVTCAWQRDAQRLQRLWTARHEWTRDSWMEPALGSMEIYLDLQNSGFRDRGLLRRLRARRKLAQGQGYSYPVQRLLEHSAADQRPGLPAFLRPWTRLLP